MQSGSGTIKVKGRDHSFCPPQSYPNLLNTKELTLISTPSYLAAMETSSGNVKLKTTLLSTGSSILNLLLHRKLLGNILTISRSHSNHHSS